MTSRRSPSVSIGLPVYNGANYVAEAIESILAQHYDDFELIIADNASSDATLRICKSYADRDPRIRILTSDSNHGAAWNFNRTFVEARGAYFKWSAHDDFLAPEFLERCVDVLEKNQNVVLAFPKCRFVDANGCTVRDHAFPRDLGSTSRRKLFLMYTSGGHGFQEIFGVFRTNVLKCTPLIGLYVGSDLVLLGRVALAGEFFEVPEVLFYHREHSQRSAVSMKKAQDYAKWYDSSNAGRVALPSWRRLVESTKSVFACDVKFSEKIGLLTDIGRAANWNKAKLLKEVLVAARLSG